MTSSASDIAADADSAFERRLAPSPSTQLTLNLPAPPATAETPLVPVRMVNEWVYCPRLAFLEWVDGEWADSGTPKKAGVPTCGWMPAEENCPHPQRHTRSPISPRDR